MADGVVVEARMIGSCCPVCGRVPGEDEIHYRATVTAECASYIDDDYGHAQRVSLLPDERERSDQWMAANA